MKLYTTGTKENRALLSQKMILFLKTKKQFQISLINVLLIQLKH